MKKDFPILTLALIFNKSIINIAMINLDAYYMPFKIKRVQVFAVSMRDLEFNIEKKARSETNSQNIV